MATIDKLNYLNDTKQMIKAELNKLGSEITDETTFRAYVDKIKNIYNDYPKVTGTGTEITLNNTKKGRMDIGLKGNTSQDGTPTPDAPITVKVVKGNNTISIGSTNYPINLGNIELCKIGDYQDYIYKNNGKWYKKGLVDKLIINGTEENLSFQSAYNRINLPFDEQTQDWGLLALTLCSHAIMGNTETVDGSFNITRTTITLKNDSLTSLNDWKTWLQSNPITIYYIKNNISDTEITDITLINQLEAIYNAHSFDNTTIITQTNADLPFNLTASALMKGSV